MPVSRFQPVRLVCILFASPSTGHETFIGAEREGATQPSSIQKKSSNCLAIQPTWPVVSSRTPSLDVKCHIFVERSQFRQQSVGLNNLRSGLMNDAEHKTIKLIKASGRFRMFTGAEEKEDECKHSVSLETVIQTL